MVFKNNNKYEIKLRPERAKDNAIVYCVDSNKNCNYQCIYSIFSLIKSNQKLCKTAADVFLLTTKDNPYIRYYRTLSVNVIFIDKYVDEHFSKIDIKNRNTKRSQNVSTYYRFFVFKAKELLPYRKILYLDCDTIIFDRLDTLFNGCPNAGCYAVPEIKINRNPVSELIHFIKDYDVKTDDNFNPVGYFNAGVMLFNFKYVNRGATFDKCVELMKYNFTWHDQDILNTLFSDFSPLDCKFNSFKFTDLNYQNRTDTVIEHVCSYKNIQANIRQLGEKIIKCADGGGRFEYIPKIMHFIWINESDELPVFVQKSLEAYKKLNPGFKINFIREKSVARLANPDAVACWNLIQTNDGNIYNRLFNNQKNIINTKKYERFQNIRFSDVFRFYLLEKYGGIYLDCDTFPVRPFDDNLLQYDFKTCRSFIGKTPVVDDICVNDIFFIAAVPHKIFEYYKGTDPVVPNKFIADQHTALYEYTDRNFETYAALGHNMEIIKKLHDRYYGECDLLPGVDRIHIQHDWNNMEKNYYVDHYNYKSWLK